MSSFDYQKSTLTKYRSGTASDPYIDITETKTVVHGQILLNEIPVQLNKVKIVGMFETPSTNKNVLKANEYRVDYSEGIISFHESAESTQKTYSYKGRGNHYVSAARIWTEEHDGNVVKTLKDAVDASNEAIIKVDNLDKVIAEAEVVKQEMKDATDYTIEKSMEADESAIYAREQGDHAKLQAGYAKDQGDFAKTQGNEAKDQTNIAIGVIGNANAKIDELEESIQESNQKLTELESARLDTVAATEDAKIETERASTEADYAKEQGTYAKEQGDYALTQGNFAKEQGNYAKDQGNFAKDEAENAVNVTKLGNEKIVEVDESIQRSNNKIDELETERLKAVEATLKTIEQGNKAALEADTAKLQGEYAKQQGDFAKLQGEYAEEQGAYALEQATSTKELLIEANNKVVELDEALTKANDRIAETEEAITETNASSVYAKEQGDFAKEQGEFSKSVAESLVHKGNYSETVTYDNRNIVYYNGATFMCVASSLGNDPTNSNFWKRITNMAWQGRYITTTTYNFGDVVTDETNQSVYMCIVEGTVGVSPSVETNWDLLMSVKDSVDIVTNLIIEMNEVKQQAITATTDANLAAAQAMEYAEEAEEQGHYAKEQGDYAKQETEIIIQKGTALINKGTYKNDETYKPLNIVVYENGVYQNILESLGVMPTESSHWQLLMQTTSSVTWDSIAGRPNVETVDGAQIKADQAEENAKEYADTKQTVIKLPNNFADPNGVITLYPEGYSVFYVGGGTGGKGSAWRVATGASEAFGYVETVRVGAGGYQTFTEMYSGTDSENVVNNKQYKRNKRDSNLFWQPFEHVLDMDDYNTVVKDAKAYTDTKLSEIADIIESLQPIVVNETEPMNPEPNIVWFNYKKFKRNLGSAESPNWVEIRLDEGIGELSHVEGEETVAVGKASHAEGHYTRANVGFDKLVTSAQIASPLIIQVTDGSRFRVGDKIEIVRNEYSVQANVLMVSENKITIDQSPSYYENPNVRIPFPKDSDVFNLSWAKNYEAYGHSEGYKTYALGIASHAEGQQAQAIGQGSHAEGFATKSTGYSSHAEGNQSISSGDNSHAEGFATKASGATAHTEGNQTEATAENAHAEGFKAIASGVASHAEGANTKASGENSHAEGSHTEASGRRSHAEGTETQALDESAHAEGYQSVASGEVSHAEGMRGAASGFASHAEGQETTASGDASHTEGYGTQATGSASHAEGNSTKAKGNQSHAQGHETLATGEASHAQGIRTIAAGKGSHSEGYMTSTAYRLIGMTSLDVANKTLVFSTDKDVSPFLVGEEVCFTWKSSPTDPLSIFETTIASVNSATNTVVLDNIPNIQAGVPITQTRANGGLFKKVNPNGGVNAHAEGSGTSATGEASHAEGAKTTASGTFSHAEGFNTKATGIYTHAEGYGTQAVGISSHAEGEQTIASGRASHAEGSSTTAIGEGSHAEGVRTKTSGNGTHAEGTDTVAIGYSSHSEGTKTVASGDASHAEGYNTLAAASISHAEGQSNSTGRGAKVAGFDFVNNTILLSSLPTGTIFSTNDEIKLVYEYYNEPYEHETKVVSFTGLSIVVENLNLISSSNTQLLGYVVNLTQSSAYSKVGGAHAEGYMNLASGYMGAHVEGSLNVALADSAHAEGFKAIASGVASHAEGQETIASGNASHAEGSFTKATGIASHAEGRSTQATGENSHAEGIRTQARGSESHAEGKDTEATGGQSHAEGEGTRATNYYAHAEGYLSRAEGSAAHAEGSNTTASGRSSHAEGLYTKTTSDASHAEGSGTIASGVASHAEGVQTTASGEASHAEGYQSTALGNASHAEGEDSKALGQGSHAEGRNTVAVGIGSHAEGDATYTGPAYNVISNNSNTITLSALFAGSFELVVGSKVGYFVSRVAGEWGSDIVTAQITAINGNVITIDRTDFSGIRLLLMEENLTTKQSGQNVSGLFAHVEGSRNIASGFASHVEGSGNYTFGHYSHVEGAGNTVLGNYCHAEGYGTNTTNTPYSHIMGQNGDTKESGSWHLANGTSATARGLAARISYSGGMYTTKAYSTGGADYAEMFEWEDNNLNNEDRVGHFVTLDGDKIRIANSDDSYILGIVSADPSVIGDNQDLHWKGRYLRDEWDRIKYHMVDIPAEVKEFVIGNDENGSPVYETVEISPSRTERQPMINPDWEADQYYARRELRPEWSAIGMMGKLLVRDDGTASVNGFVLPNDDGIATTNESGFRVMKRVSENIIQVLVK